MLLSTKLPQSLLTKKKGFSQRGSGNSVPSHFNESPFANSISRNSEKVNSNERNSKISEENGVGWEDLKKSLPETDDAG